MQSQLTYPNISNVSHNVIQQISILNNKLQSLITWTTNMDKTIKNYKMEDQHNHPPNSIKNELFEQILLNLESKVNCFVKEIQKFLNKIGERLTEKMKEKDFEKRLSSLIVKLQEKYNLQIKEIQEHYKLQLDGIIEEYTRQQKLITARIDLIEIKYTNIIEDYKRKQAENLIKIKKLQKQQFQELKIGKNDENMSKINKKQLQSQKINQEPSVLIVPQNSQRMLINKPSTDPHLFNSFKQTKPYLDSSKIQLGQTEIKQKLSRKNKSPNINHQQPKQQLKQLKQQHKQQLKQQFKQQYINRQLQLIKQRNIKQFQQVKEIKQKNVHQQIKITYNPYESFAQINTSHNNSDFPALKDFSIDTWQQSSVKNLTRVWQKFDDEENSQNEEISEYFPEDI